MLQRRLHSRRTLALLSASPAGVRSGAQSSRIGRLRGCGSRLSRRRVAVGTSQHSHQNWSERSVRLDDVTISNSRATVLGRRPRRRRSGRSQSRRRRCNGRRRAKVKAATLRSGGRGGLAIPSNSRSRRKGIERDMFEIHSEHPRRSATRQSPKKGDVRLDLGRRYVAPANRVSGEETPSQRQMVSIR